MGTQTLERITETDSGQKIMDDFTENNGWGSSR